MSTNPVSSTAINTPGASDFKLPCSTGTPPQRPLAAAAAVQSDGVTLGHTPTGRAAAGVSVAGATCGLIRAGRQHGARITPGAGGGRRCLLRSSTSGLYFTDRQRSRPAYPPDFLRVRPPLLTWFRRGFPLTPHGGDGQYTGPRSAAFFLRNLSPAHRPGRCLDSRDGFLSTVLREPSVKPS